MKGLTRLLSSILVLQHIVDHGSGMFHAVLTGIDAPCAVFPRLPVVDASVALELHLEICTFFYVPPVFSAFPCSKFCASRFFGALEHSQVLQHRGVHSQVLGRRMCIINSQELWTYTLFLKVVSKTTTTTIIQSGEVPFSQARSLHPTLGS